ncbi:RNA polymerase I-specific transcription initiation factor RRN7 [Wickerhamomyces ciferrii]|uniref:RNA polymerase I-specific transcription initiation factor RRN7 n=1 Tax=Wickerhamomyces ciferrii (strain ATCC 14091 / BCRC 22168 / CBS 111 / JCM 3599 / NBRC 0793 / NRRL Y-1031 F-60-10) TaxID=1206466 RepID=K0KR24_WICCF|nr:RNA polymerase I-specific transcription initiation factor RRN7 [Wickerhamomyces ciferrii]CCH43738.1 RNA polymerase I-specific transcription initiation factor RRN7 [Wickerhamomyces ciferrii]
MSGPWIRGTRCGVDNCRSKYYRSVDGRRICQYGHVNEGHIDYNDEDDDNFVVTRRLNIPQSQPGMSQGSQITPGLERDESKRRLFGRAARELYFKCFQTILKLQIKSLINEHGVPEVFEKVAKNVYLQYLNAFFNTDEAFESLGYETADSHVTSDEESQNPKLFTKKLPSHIDTLAICYLAARYLQLPLYLNDLVQWATSRRIPYMRASHDLPKNLSSRLPNIMLTLLDPGKPPVKGDICNSVTTIMSSIDMDLKFNYKPLLFRSIKELILSPEIYFAVLKFIELNDINFNFEKSSRSGSHKLRNTDFRNKSQVISFPEIKLIPILICVTKLYFSSAHDREYRLQYDWKTWCETVNDRKVNGTWSGDSNDLLSSLFVSKDSISDVIDWNDKQTKEYLDWFTERILDHPDNSEIPLHKKRLYDIFPLPEEEIGVDNGNGDDHGDDMDMDFENNEGEELDTYEEAYQRMITAPIDFPMPLKDEEATIIENVLVENLSMMFGVTEHQLRSALRKFESQYFKKMM